MRILFLGLLCTILPEAMAQDSNQASPVPKRDDATTLDTIRVTAPRPEILDLDRFKNPIDPNPSRFDRDYREPPSLEDISLNGGLIPLLVGYLVQKIPAGASRIPGWKDHEQPAIARPPPLTEEQMQRAVRLQDGSR